MTVLVPAVVPSVKVLDDNPLALVELLADDNDPTPEVIVQSTVAPKIILLFASLTIAINGFEAAVPTAAD